MVLPFSFYGENTQTRESILEDKGLGGIQEIEKLLDTKIKRHVVSKFKNDFLMKLRLNTF